MKEILESIIVGAIITIAIFVLYFGNANTSITYACSNGNYGYTYRTEAICNITEINPVNETVTISYKGNEYSFYANGYWHKDMKVHVIFNENMEIINAWPQGQGK